ncbi:hypothetical protein CANARDRAFT_9939 [[Candida] arabinofermentans NRRL YB-2248]|uniref:Uncharacterized protein n=1 Tax=[Candida] arabinofermentans NRRL YB-2248 TaxID=983967 RepID=A0A1E4SU97_9ASCO|nr:hypothetical protein CANARDRAFT_9939 [[Candida] arabinofermentans NRRL YB-2248]
MSAYQRYKSSFGKYMIPPLPSEETFYKLKMEGYNFNEETDPEEVDDDKHELDSDSGNCTSLLKTDELTMNERTKKRKIIDEAGVSSTSAFGTRRVESKLVSNQEGKGTYMTLALSYLDKGEMGKSPIFTYSQQAKSKERYGVGVGVDKKLEEPRKDSVNAEDEDITLSDSSISKLETFFSSEGDESRDMEEDFTENNTRSPSTSTIDVSFDMVTPLDPLEDEGKTRNGDQFGDMF